MSSTVKVGTILMRDSMEQLFELESGPSPGNWSVVKTLDGVSLDRKIRAAGWHFLFMAAEVKVMFFGALKPAKIQDALRQILAKVKPQHFNSLEVTGIAARHFLGVPYAVVTAHSRHVQQSCCLESAEVRGASQQNWESAGV